MCNRSMLIFIVLYSDLLTFVNHIRVFPGEIGRIKSPNCELGVEADGCNMLPWVSGVCLYFIVYGFAPGYTGRFTIANIRFYILIPA